ncbi:MAG: bifunctional nicotinamidase/pyrazinamidase [Pirellulales bacterium]|nr:bifunctional nicotinamidase/pyrazinamidase [Pirellulales bacterium]
MKALILVDIQNDFIPGGALAVRDGDQVVPAANRLMPRFELVVATKDWHPANHLSFASQHPGKGIGDVIDLNGLPQVLWPDHCVEGTPGAEFVPGLDVIGITQVFEKGTDRTVDSYSGFFDNGRRQATGLEDFLRGRHVDEVFILGLATDYCVKFTALDAASLGFKTHLLLDGCRGVDLRPGDVDRAVEEMRAAGVLVE